MPRRPPSQKETKDSDGGKNWSHFHKKLLLISLAGIVIVGLVPEFVEVRQLSFRSLQTRFTKHENQTEAWAPSPPKVGWVDYSDFPLTDNGGSSNLMFPLEDEWLIPPFPYHHKVPLSSRSIPKLLHKVILNRNGEFPPGFLADKGNSSSSSNTFNNKAINYDDEIINRTSLENAHASWQKFNPSYAIRYYNLRLARLYLGRHFHPIFLRAFDCIEAFAGKADLFRYAILYREGGFYSDWKQVCMVDGLLDQLAENCTWFSAIDKELAHGAMQNAFIGSVPQHPVLAETIRGIFSHLQTKYDEDAENVFVLTGPHLLGAAVRKVGLQQGVDGVKYGVQRRTRHWAWSFFYIGNLIVIGKCDGCGQWSQNWTSGNNYNRKFDKKEYFCPDAESLLATTVDH